MDSPICIFVLIIVSTLAIFHQSDAQGQGCSPPRGWVSKPLQTRAQEATDIIYGTVSGIYQGNRPEEYLVEMDVMCVMKGTATTGRANITEVGSDCIDNAMRKGISYIVFVHTLRDGSGRNRYVTHDINVELAANKATQENFSAIRKSGVSNQCNKATYQPANAEPDGTGHEGHGHGPAKGQCTTPGGCGNAGNAMVAGSLWMLSALVYTVVTHWNTGT